MSYQQFQNQADRAMQGMIDRNGRANMSIINIPSQQHHGQGLVVQTSLQQHIPKQQNEQQTSYPRQNMGGTSDDVLLIDPSANVATSLMTSEPEIPDVRWSWCGFVMSVISMTFCGLFGFVAVMMYALGYADHKVKDHRRSRNKRNVGLGFMIAAFVLGLIVLALTIVIITIAIANVGDQMKTAQYASRWAMRDTEQAANDARHAAWSEISNPDDRSSGSWNAPADFNTGVKYFKQEINSEILNNA